MMDYISFYLLYLSTPPSIRESPSHVHTVLFFFTRTKSSKTKKREVSSIQSFSPLPDWVWTHPMIFIHIESTCANPTKNRVCEVWLTVKLELFFAFGLVPTWDFRSVAPWTLLSGAEFETIYLLNSCWRSIVTVLLSDLRARASLGYVYIGSSIDSLTSDLTPTHARFVLAAPVKQKRIRADILSYIPPKVISEKLSTARAVLLSPLLCHSSVSPSKQFSWTVPVRMTS